MFQNRLLFYKKYRIIFKNYSQKLFFKIIFENNYQTDSYILKKIKTCFDYQSFTR